MGDFAIDEVLELVAAREVIHGNDVGLAARIERFNNVRTNKAGRAGHYDGHVFSFLKFQASCQSIGWRPVWIR